MNEHKEELAILESLDSGAVYTLALKTHIGMSIDSFHYFAGWCDKIQACCWASDTVHVAPHILTYYLYYYYHYYCFVGLYLITWFYIG